MSANQRETNINIDIESVPMNVSLFHRMIFIQNALNQGWAVKKRNESYIFTKKHENRREIMHESYLEKFIKSNSTMTANL